MTFSTKNPYAKSNVNVAQGPGTGNHGTPSKRADFKSAKEERAPLADVIAKAYGARAQKDSIDTKLEGIEPNVKPRKFKR